MYGARTTSFAKRFANLELKLVNSRRTGQGVYNINVTHSNETGLSRPCSVYTVVAMKLISNGKKKEKEKKIIIERDFIARYKSEP